LNNTNTMMVSIPGEAIVELGSQIRNDSAEIGFDQTFLLGYTNNYMMYFTTPREYLIGGYEAFLTTWGIHTSDKIRSSALSAMNLVR